MLDETTKKRVQNQPVCRGFPPLVLKRLYNLSDEQMEYQLLDRHSYQRFCGLVDAARLPDRPTIGHFENRIGVAGAEAPFAAVEQQILQHGYVARGGQIIDGGYLQHQAPGVSRSGSYQGGSMPVMCQIMGKWP